MAITFEPARPTDRAALESLLTSFQLATEDLPDNLDGFTLALDNGLLIGSVGLEQVGPYGLLRSVAVQEAYRNLGVGQRLYTAALNLAQAAHLRELWLVTNTAADYFEKHGFERIDRAGVPVEITAIPQFTTLCPSSAIVMHKTVP